MNREGREDFARSGPDGDFPPAIPQALVPSASLTSVPELLAQSNLRPTPISHPKLGSCPIYLAEEGLTPAFAKTRPNLIISSHCFLTGVFTLFPAELLKKKKKHHRNAGKGNHDRKRKQTNKQKKTPSPFSCSPTSPVHNSTRQRLRFCQELHSGRTGNLGREVGRTARAGPSA